MFRQFKVLLLGTTLAASSIAFGDVYKDNSHYNLTTANNGGQVKLREAPAGTGSPAAIKNLINSAQLPAVVRDSKLTTGVYSRNIAQLDAVKETLSYLANSRPATYTGNGTVVTQNNLEQHRNAIANNGGTFVFRGTIDITGKNKLIQVGANTTVWVDGTVRYTGPVIPGTIPDEYSVSDVINGIFEVRGTKNLAKANTKIFGTKRGKILGNDRLAAVYTRYVKDFRVEGLNTDNCRNVLFLNNAYGNSIAKGNFIYNSTRRAIHVKASNNITVENNLVFDADVDGIDIDAYTKNSKTLRNVLIDSGSRWMVWTEIASVDNIIDGNVGIHVNNDDGGFQENGSESNGQPATARNVWRNNHIFYVDSTSNWKQGFSFHPKRVIDRASVSFTNNYTWQTRSDAYKRNPKADTLDDVAYYHYTGNNDNPPDDSDDGSTEPPVIPGTDQCDTTQQCKTLFGSSASDCKNSQSNNSICMCGSSPCGDNTPEPTAEPTPTPPPADDQYSYSTHSIPGLIELEDFDVGGQDIAYGDSNVENTGGAYRSEGVDLQATDDNNGGYNIGWVADGEWLEYTIASVSSGKFDILLRVAAPTENGNKAVRVSLGNKVLGTINIAGTGNWQSWKTLRLNNVSLNSGTDQVLRLEAVGGRFNLNWIDFQFSNDTVSSTFTIEAEDFDNTGGAYQGFEVYSTSQGVTAINYNQRGDWADYTVYVPATGNYTLEAWTGTTQANGAIEVLKGNTTYISKTVPNNGNWDKFVKVTGNGSIPLTEGQQTIRIRSAGSTASTWEWNADKFVFTQQ